MDSSPFEEFFGWICCYKKANLREAKDMKTWFEFWNLKTNHTMFYVKPTDRGGHVWK